MMFEMERGNKTGMYFADNEALSEENLSECNKGILRWNNKGFYLTVK